MPHSVPHVALRASKKIESRLCRGRVLSAQIDMYEMLLIMCRRVARLGLSTTFLFGSRPRNVYIVKTLLSQGPLASE